MQKKVHTRIKQQTLHTYTYISSKTPDSYFVKIISFYELKKPRYYFKRNNRGETN